MGIELSEEQADFLATLTIKFVNDIFSLAENYAKGQSEKELANFFLKFFSRLSLAAIIKITPEDEKSFQYNVNLFKEDLQYEVEDFIETMLKEHKQNEQRTH